MGEYPSRNVQLWGNHIGGVATMGAKLHNIMQAKSPFPPQI